MSNIKTGVEVKPFSLIRWCEKRNIFIALDRPAEIMETTLNAVFGDFGVDNADDAVTK